MSAMSGLSTYIEKEGVEPAISEALYKLLLEMPSGGVQRLGEILVEQSKKKTLMQLRAARSPSSVPANSDICVIGLAVMGASDRRTQNHTPTL